MNTEQIMGFDALNVSSALCARLKRLDITTPTPIQAGAIPPAMEGRDIIGIAQTGTGKTLAFGLPMIANLPHSKIGLVLAPTRELAIQIQDTFNKLNLQTALLIGGAPMGKQIRELRSRPQVIIATPGRLEDHMNNNMIDVRNVTILVLDEADRMLDIGFGPAIKRIFRALGSVKQTMMFSATMPRSIEELTEAYLEAPVKIEIEKQGTVADKVDQSLIVLKPDEKPDILKDLLYDHSGTILIFARTRYGASKLAKKIRMLGHTADEIHSDRTLNQRRNALEGFKEGRHRILVATDIAARGIDVKNISLVINYDLPDNSDDYIHRIGRTGRAGASGLAITLATPDQWKDIRDIEKLMQFEFPISDWSTAQMQKAPAPRAPGAPKPAGRSGGNRPKNRGANNRERMENRESRPSGFSSGGFSSSRPSGFSSGRK
jgi:ATP-dependent RNA helicase RhlE